MPAVGQGSEVVARAFADDDVVDLDDDAGRVGVTDVEEECGVAVVTVLPSAGEVIATVGPMVSTVKVEMAEPWTPEA